MKITSRLAILFLAASLLPMGLLSLQYCRSGKAALRKEVLDHLGSVARHIERQVEYELKQYQSKMELVLIGRSMLKSFEDRLRAGGWESRKPLAEILDRVQAKVPEFSAFVLLDTLGRVVMTHGPGAAVDAAVLQKIHRKDWRKGVVDLWVPDRKGLSLFLGGPLAMDGRLLGMAVVRAPGLDLTRIIEYPEQNRWSIKPFLVSLRPDSTVLFVFPPEHAGDLARIQAGAVLGSTVSGHFLKSMKDTLFSDLIDYRGVPVLAAVRFLEVTEWGLVVKVDQERAFTPIRRFLNQTMFALGAASVLAILCGILVSRRLTQPLLELIAMAREYSAGHLARRSRSRSRDELGELSRSLDSIAENLVSRRELQNYIDQMSTLSVKLDLEGKVLTANRAFQNGTNRAEAGILGRPFLEGAWLFEGAEAVERMRGVFEEAKRGEVMHLEETLLVEGRIRKVHFTFNPLRDEAGAVEAVIAEGRDITALKDAQAALYEVNEGLEESVRERTRSLQGALREKDMLLREIHHRVKNNLQIISSLLSLQSVHVRDPQVAGILTESRNRVKSMALVHERLYAGDDLGKVGFSGYIRDLAAQLVRSSEGPARGVTLQFELEDISVGLTQAIPCGLSIHELVANCLKHAFPDGKSARGGQATVTIRCRPLPAGGFELEVEDNGRGLPEGFDPKKSRTLGLQLVFTLVKQLKGVLEVDRGEGTRVRIGIPGPDEREDSHAG